MGRQAALRSLSGSECAALFACGAGVHAVYLAFNFGAAHCLLGTPLAKGSMLDRDFVMRTFETNKIEAVFHFAALSPIAPPVWLARQARHDASCGSERVTESAHGGCHGPRVVGGVHS